jgi:hypothetical protein
MTGGAGNTFALISASVDKPGGTAVVKFTIDPSQFTLPRHNFTLGVDVAASTGSAIKPLISSIGGPHGMGVPQAFHSIYAPHLTHAQVASGAGTSAVLSPIGVSPHNFKSGVTYTVKVQATAHSSGKFLLDFYLPGDVNGDGVVDQQDVALVKSLQGTTAADPNYSFDADANRDGRIGKQDLAFVRQNLGVKTTVLPVISANLDTPTVAAAPARTVSVSTAHFSGVATPGTSITFSEVSHQVPNASATADATGKYALDIPLAAGTNTFHVNASDAFGQAISGTIAPVSYRASK